MTRMVVCLSFLFLFVIAHESEFIVNTKQGPIRGITISSIEDREYYAFLGIPYAKPPVGKLRFKAPEPPSPWDGTYDATEERNELSGDEDCLYLNVYTNELPPTELKAVMVWIHGGCFKSGSGSAMFYAPDHLLTEDVVVVAINYRLGLLGFLSLPEAGIPGNNGLKDQTMSLIWVQNNIEKFGGDPNKVTIFGESAGGASVHYHLLSPMSKVSFKSREGNGSALHEWAYADPQYMVDKSFNIGERMGCKTNNANELLACLENANSDVIINCTEGKVFSMSNSVVPLRPTVENAQMTDEQIFLPESPLELVRQGKFYNVPYITGINSREGIIYMQEIQSIPGFWDNPRHHLTLVLGDILSITPEQADEVVKMAVAYYIGDGDMTSEYTPEIVDMFSDIAFVRGTVNAAKEHAQLSKSPLYLYLFSFDGDLGIVKLVTNTKLP
ncbi:hypothetical protein L9F63_003369, partial [Diploptera punctata]